MSNLFIINEQSNENDLLSFISDSDCGGIREEKSNYYEKEIFNKNYFSNSDKKTREMTNLQKKRGRKKYKENVKEEHTKFFLDNQIAKILVHYHKFLINLANAYLEAKNFYNKKFFPISGAFTKKRDLLTLKGLLNSSLRDILKQQVSEKYINLSHNKELMEYFDSEKFPDEFKEFFDMKYKFIYSEIFLMNNKDKLLNSFGINKNLNMYEDFILSFYKTYEQKYIDIMKETCKNFISHIELTTPKIQKKKKNKKYN